MSSEEHSPVNIQVKQMDSNTRKRLGDKRRGHRTRTTARNSKKTSGDNNSNKVPTDAGIKKKRTSKHRLYSSFKNEKLAKKELSNESKDGEEKKKGTTKSTSVHRRNKIAWYQNSSELPTSVNTLKKEMCQLFDIMKDQGLLCVDEEIENPLKKARVPRPSSTENGNKRSKRVGRKAGTPIIDKFSISKEALHNVHQVHAYYMGEILKTAQEVVENGKKMTVTPDVLDLALVFTHKSIGPKWNIMLQPGTTITPSA